MNLYFCKTFYYNGSNDEEEREVLFVPAESLNDLVEKLDHWYGKDNLIEFSVKTLNDTGCLALEDIEENTELVERIRDIAEITTQY